MTPTHLLVAGADRQVGDYQRCAWSDESAAVIVEVGRDAYSIREVLQIRHPLVCACA